MRAVIDTNVLISGLLWHGPPHAVLALAIAAKADLIVSGDKDLLILESHAGIPIIDAAAAQVLIG